MTGKSNTVVGAEENWCPKCGTGITVDAGGTCRTCGQHQASCDEWYDECDSCDWHLLLKAHAKLAAQLDVIAQMKSALHFLSDRTQVFEPEPVKATTRYTRSNYANAVLEDVERKL